MAGVVTVGPKTATTKTLALSSAQKSKNEQAKQAQEPAISGKQAQLIEQKQSLALVQIMLHASFGTIFYLREFLPLSCFGDCDLITLSKKSGRLSYEQFSAPKSSDDIAEAFGRRGQPMKTILRNREGKADRLLDLLENGIFDALAKSALEAVQLTVFVDKNQPTQVLESYTFTFKYTGDAGDVNNRLASMSLDSVGCTAEMTTFRSARQGLEMIIRRLITLSSFLPVLPSKRFLEIHLFYNDDCPPEYEPPGFAPASNDQVIYPSNEFWKKETQSCGKMDGGFHSVGLKVTSLKWLGDSPGDSTSRPEVPETIDYSEFAPRGEDIDMDNQHELVHVAAPSQSASQQSTQTRKDEAAKKMLQKMLVPSTPDSNLTPTQANTQSMGNASFSVRPQLSQVKICTIRREREKSPAVSGLVAYDTGTKASTVVDCQCGLDKDEGDSDMIQCAFCNCRQHLTCYGFLHANDRNIPDTHACYKCLLGLEQPALLREMDTLVLLRRAIKIISEEGYPLRLKDFAQKLNCNGDTVVQVRDLLKKRGFLRATPASKSRNQRLPMFRIPDSPAIREKLRNEIFNPLAKISHYYDVPEDLQTGPGVSHDSLMESQACGSQSVARDPLLATVSYGSQPGNNPSAIAPGVARGENSSTEHRPMIDMQLSSVKSTRSRRQRHSGEDASELGVESTHHELANDGGGDLHLRKKRRLSNILDPIDICEPMDEDSD